jgi:hypothetical protein
LKRKQGDHVSRHETPDVQVWSAIQFEFIVDKLIRSIRRDPLLRETGLWHSITTGVRRGNIAVSIMANPCITDMIDDILGINVLKINLVHCHVLYLVENHTYKTIVCLSGGKHFPAQTYVANLKGTHREFSGRCIPP